MFIQNFKFNSIFNYKKFFLNIYRPEQKIFNFAYNITCAVVRFAWEVEIVLYKFAKNIKLQLYLLMKEYKHLVIWNSRNKFCYTTQKKCIQCKIISN